MTTPPTSTFPLALRQTRAAVGAAAAWLIPGSDPRAWLAEVVRWGVATEDLRFFVVPSSSEDLTPIGALVVPPAGAGARDVERGLPYRLVAGRLYVPADAELWPPVADAELAAMLRLPVQVLHPTGGLSGFAEADAVRARDLLAPPTEQPSDWSLGTAGESVRPRVRSVAPDEPPDVSGVLEAGRDDIGSAAPAALPRTPDESALREAARRAGVAPAKLAEAMAMGPLRFMAWLSAQLARLAGKPARPPPLPPATGASGPPGAPGRGWAQRLEDWAAGKFRDLNRRLQDERARELARLRRMLDDDPDEGLRHAIPLRDLPGRGRAEPSAHLGRRDVNFSLPKALGGGGGPVDAWDVPPDAVESLTRQYREAANRELRLGRYRRAAYVLAELLGDFAAAANALEQGRHFREAAVLYRDKLGNAAKAAECLEGGGLLTEAAAAYEALKQFERAGDLLARIDRPEEAARCYRRQADAHFDNGDLLAAARVLEVKLAAPDEALALLSDAWPWSDAAGACLRATFDLLGRLGRHEASAARAHDLARAAAAPARAAALAGTLAAVAGNYPDRAVRAAAADATRVVAARSLPGTSGTDRQAVARAVATALPQDKLLARDVERYLARHPGVAVTPAAPPRGGHSGAVTVVRRFTLPGGVVWTEVVSGTEGFYALGLRTGVDAAEPRYVAVRGTWAGACQAAELWRAVPTSARLHLLPGRAVVLLVTPGTSLRVMAKFPRNDAFRSSAHVVQPAWVAPSAVAAGIDEAGRTWALAPGSGGEPTLSVFGTLDGRLLETHALPGVAWPADPPDRLLVRGDAIFAPWGDDLLRFDPAGKGGWQRIPAGSIVTRLAAAAPGGPLLLAAAAHDGGLVLWRDGRSQLFADGLAYPLVTFTRGGVLIALGRDGGGAGGRAYQADGEQLRLVAKDFDGTAEAAVAMTATNRLDEFAVFAAHGSVTVFRLPE